MFYRLGKNSKNPQRRVANSHLPPTQIALTVVGEKYKYNYYDTIHLEWLIVFMRLSGSVVKTNFKN